MSLAVLLCSRFVQWWVISWNYLVMGLFFALNIGGLNRKIGPIFVFPEQSDIQWCVAESSAIDYVVRKIVFWWVVKMNDHDWDLRSNIMLSLCVFVCICRISRITLIPGRIRSSSHNLGYLMYFIAYYTSDMLSPYIFVDWYECVFCVVYTNTFPHITYHWSNTSI